jgi:signal transduction histidine kinase
MRAISNRIRRLVRALVPPVLEEGESGAEILRARRRRRLEAAGLPFVEEPRIRWTAAQCRNVSLVDILSGRYREKTAR